MEETNKKTKKKSVANPLYVVRNNGVDVEAATGLLDLLLKKTGIDKFIPLLESLMAILMAQVQSYPVFIEVKKLMDKIFEKVIEILFQIQQLTAKKSV